MAYLEQGRGEGFDKAKPAQHKSFNGNNQRQGYNQASDMQFVKAGKRFDNDGPLPEKKVKH